MAHVSVLGHRLWQRSVPEHMAGNEHMAGDVHPLLFWHYPLICIGSLLTWLCIFSPFVTATQETQSMANWESESTGSALLIRELVFGHILSNWRATSFLPSTAAETGWILPSLITHQLSDRLLMLHFEKCPSSIWNNSKSQFLSSCRQLVVCLLSVHQDNKLI